MKTKSVRCEIAKSDTSRLLLSSLSMALAGTIFPIQSFAQALLPPTVVNTDENHVDLISGRVFMSQKLVSAGPADQGGLDDTLLISTALATGTGGVQSSTTVNPTDFIGFKNYAKLTPRYTTDPVTGLVERTAVDIALNGKNVGFYDNGAGASPRFIPSSPASIGSTLVANPDNVSYTLTLTDGTQIYLAVTSKYFTAFPLPIGVVEEIALGTVFTHPDGRIEKVYYRTATPTTNPLLRIKSVTSNAGWILKYGYSDDGVLPTSISGFNLSQSNCDPTADTCAIPSNARTSSLQYVYSGTNLSQLLVTDPLGGVTRYSFSYPTLTFNNGGVYTAAVLDSVKPPSSSTDVYTYTYGPIWQAPFEYGYQAPMVSSVSRNGSTWTYSRNDTTSSDMSLGSLSRPALNRVTTVTAPDSGNKTYVVLNALGVFKMMSSITDAANRQTKYDYHQYTFINKVTHPLGNYTTFSYDLRSNITSKVDYPVPGSGLVPLTTTANYDATCTNPAKCNKPNSVVDPKGNVTSYTYDANTGLVTMVAKSAAVAGGIQPVKSFAYQQFNAYFQDPVGTNVASGSPIWLKTAESECMTQASCSGTSDEVKTTFDYGPQTAGTANNLLLRSSSAIFNGVPRTTCITYDVQGNVQSKTEPNAGLGACP